MGLVLRLLSDNLNILIKPLVDKEEWNPTDSGVAMYLGNVLESLHSCLYEEKRDVY